MGFLERLHPAGGHSPTAGVYHFQREEPQGKARVHLRLEKDGRGVLLVNAARIYQLNPTAAYMAYLLLEKRSEQAAVREITRRYRVPASQARADLEQMRVQLEAITAPDAGCPVCELDLETNQPFSDRPSAPYRMDLALTYRCNNDCAHCYNGRSRRFPEMDTGQWRAALDRLWEIGIPHIVFTGGEPTLRKDLPELVAHAERNGQIAGLNTNGRRLKDAAFVAELVSAGLDHVQITLESHIPDVHDRMVGHAGAWAETTAGIRNALSSRLFVMTNTTLLADNTAHLEGTLDFLADLGVPTLGLNALIYSGRGEKVGTGLPASVLPDLLEIARQKTDRTGQRLIWYTPTQYCHFDPVLLDLGVKGCTAALYNMCVEPDGSVLPCQSYYSSLGNLLTSDWPEIWNHELAVTLRERQNIPDECQTCRLLPECGGGCPLERRHNLPIPLSGGNP